ncbi:hypothetical protein PISMIDRAFT_690048 [Pisolithus microcarpus 441]|uniref:Uncharacterized protein n=1 Tax=Pisolithus microcarpus 441 TaxID=765257 RepID=A0A0C9Y3U9_9AGAM|nr:hypothetical protein BKA83DRAFT_690048 [Pisolithus microcarpus]KIK11771.1 hypothetical protein PISMIDRAFT_690048 [Pisolithus microcarpus 441]
MVQLQGADPLTPSYTYNRCASGLAQLRITLPVKLADVRPWHLRLLGPFSSLLSPQTVLAS